MDNSSSYVLKIKVWGELSQSQAQALANKVSHLPAVTRVEFDTEKKLLSVAARAPIQGSKLDYIASLYRVDFTLADSANNSAPAVPVPDKNGAMQVSIEGMHCRSCELTIERKFGGLPGVTKVKANADKGMVRVNYVGQPPTIDSLQQIIADDGYNVHALANGKVDKSSFMPKERPSIWQLIILVALVLVLGKVMSGFGLLSPNIGALNSTSFLAVFLLGLVAASSSCLAVSGGLLLSTVGKFNERYGNARFSVRMRPVFLFVGGRLVAYGLLGGLIGLLGSALTPSATVTGAITLLAAFYMLVMGLDMLHLAPQWLKRLIPRMPKILSHKVLAAQGRTNSMVPFLLGAGTFFLPCGFTQALQLYALTTGSFWTSAWLLFGFALGTAPALLALGFASGSFKGNLGKLFFRFAGVLVVMLGLWNFQNGLTVVGYPIQISHWYSLGSSAAETNDPNVVFAGDQQIIKMAVNRDGYSPNQFTIKKGMPTRWEVDATNGGGCLSVLISPKLGIRKLLSTSELNVIEFTPSESGTFAFSCSMGMYRGEITVVPNT